MARNITVTLFQYSELTGAAKERARNWWIESLGACQWWDATYEDAQAVLGFLGFEVDNSRGGKGPAIYFSGFSSQGDGAQFAGTWKASNVDAAGLRHHAPVDEKLHAIAAGLEAIAKQYPAGSFKITTTGNYSHEYCTDFDFDLTGADADQEEMDRTAEQVEAERQATELSREAMRWIYRQLEGDYDGQCSEESVAEAMESNEYEFTAAGKRCNG